MLEAAKNAPAAGPATTAAPKEAEVEAPADEEEPVDMGNIFGDDDEYWRIVCNSQGFSYTEFLSIVTLQ